MRDARIATCCYCGTKATLVLAGETRHELACSRCGAPLSRLKALPVDGARARRAGQAPAAAPAPARPAAPSHHGETARPARKGKRRKSLQRRALRGIWDIVEEIFD
ncbi:hypothetical protein [Wenxinia saemankumensis]|uniref:TFIIB zinc-binding n=1 Tax=Wenxinia saemankumensis TaxID=1447782 RepID=A0A1M6CMV2_9RHOB|nr:hypothetical protein [Wenxinia saemankumensis]SHI62372.1 hypothetical protein SAMN05444417_1275 [Wenxinia saemankumensis]